MDKSIPNRMCVVCREMKPKKELVRVVKDKEGKIFIDNSYKANGRGAYICAKQDCFEKCIKTKALNRTFKCNIEDSVLEQLKLNINKGL